jgi:pimeloyl-ACP methyl ester carboxylesterase
MMGVTMRYWPVLILSTLFLFKGPVARGQDKPAEDQQGKVVTRKVRFGEYVQYLPKREALGVLVVVHGQPAGDDIKDIHGLAERFVKRWVPFAEEHRLLVLGPVFDNENFDSVDGNQGGGYRALYGRQIAADAYVNDMIDRSKALVAKGWDGRIVLYGHSAGGQFTSRYVVKHPDRVRAAVISAAGIYAMPDPTIEWPNGSAPVNRTLYWGPSKEPQPISITPNLNGWVKASGLPITVVVGKDDTEPQKKRAGHDGSTRVEFARQWVASMNKLAERRRKKGTVRLVVVEGVGHDSARLTPAAQKALTEALDGG